MKKDQIDVTRLLGFRLTETGRTAVVQAKVGDVKPTGISSEA